MVRLMRKPTICICENKDAHQLRGNREADQRLVFAKQIVQSLFYLYPKFQAYSILLCFCSMVCVGPVQKTTLLVFPRGCSNDQDMYIFHNVCILLHLSHAVRKMVFGVSKQAPNTNRPVQSQKKARSLKFRI